jgi:hypothetical protein
LMEYHREDMWKKLEKGILGGSWENGKDHEACLTNRRTRTIEFVAGCGYRLLV